MRGTVAKRIRHQVYGEQSVRQKRRYVTEWVEKTVKRLIGKENKDIVVKKGVVKNIGLRQQYQDAKKDYYAKRRQNEP